MHATLLDGYGWSGADGHRIRIRNNKNKYSTFRIRPISNGQSIRRVPIFNPAEQQLHPRGLNRNPLITAPFHVSQFQSFFDWPFIGGWLLGRHN